MFLKCSSGNLNQGYIKQVKACLKMFITVLITKATMVSTKISTIEDWLTSMLNIIQPLKIVVLQTI